MRIRYSSNNSGGEWWLSDDDWRKLEEHGWTVNWLANNPFYQKFGLDQRGRWLGALAKEAAKEFDSVDDAINEWEKVLGMDSSEEGCSCCGQPHYFHEMNPGGGAE